jgi:AbrB family looped-hinge helix DNA binding protein
LTLKLKVGKKGIVILPKAIRESVGIEEGDNVIVELGDGITLKPERKVDLERLRAAFREHDERLAGLNTREPEPGDLAKVYLEEEFEECEPS